VELGNDSALNEGDAGLAEVDVDDDEVFCHTVARFFGGPLPLFRKA
jgi:hypothetical protein